MADDRIRYDILVQEAARGVIRKVLQETAQAGLPGEHHFFITFVTTAPGVRMADWLRERYPEEMTIVIQHWFDNLTVDDQGFTITLNFGNSPEPMRIPFDALRTFVDPSVEFGLRFETQDGDDDEEDADDTYEEVPADDDDPDDSPGGGEIVQLDHWRK